MLRGSLVIAVMGLLFSGACRAEEASLCTVTCGEELRMCKASAARQAKQDGLTAGPIERWRPSLAHTAGKLQSPTAADQAIERSSMQTRRMRHASLCDDSNARCTRACANPAAGSADSPVIASKRATD